MVTMKMIRSTNSTSTRGVTLMSDIAPPPELDANAMSASLLLVARLRPDGDVTDVEHAGLGRDGGHLLQNLHLGVAVGADVEQRLRLALRDHRQSILQAAFAHQLVVEEQ